MLALHLAVRATSHAPLCRAAGPFLSPHLRLSTIKATGHAAASAPAELTKKRKTKAPGSPTSSSGDRAKPLPRTISLGNPDASRGLHATVGHMHC